MSKTPTIPFGLRFEEYPIATDLIVPQYDEETDISVIVDEVGHKIPYVEYSGKLGTKTFTEVQAESTDDDEDSHHVDGTRTVTAVKSESTDSDEGSFSLSLGTKTETFVQSEQTDQDPGIDIVTRPPLSTGTATKVAQESTDKD